MSRVAPDPNSGCWLWLGPINTKGYGRAGAEYAHRLAHRLFVGPVEDGMCVMHRCDTRSCANPRHLRTGTPADNSRDMVQKGRSARGERHSQAKLTRAEVEYIVASTRTNADLADQFNVSVSHIHGIRRGRFWAEGE